MTTEGELLEHAASAEPLSVVLDRICRLFDQVSPGAQCSILLTEGRASMVVLGAGPALATAIRTAFSTVRKTHSPYWGPCAQAIDRAEEVHVEDLHQPHQWTGGQWDQLVKSAGLRSCSAVPLVANDGRVLGCLAVYHTQPGAPTREHPALVRQIGQLASLIVERSRVSRELRRSEAQLARAQRLSATGSFSYIAATNELSLSEETCRICGFDPERPVRAEEMRDRIHPDDLPIFRGLLGGSQQRHEFECRVRLPDGSIRHILTIGDAFRDNAGGIVEWVGVVRDITDEKATQQALQQTRSALARVSRITTIGALTASLTHDVNQPLTGVVTNSGLLLRILEQGLADSPEAHAAIQRMRRDALRAADAVQRLRAWLSSRGPTIQAVNLNKAISEVLELLRPELQRSRVRVNAELASDLKPVAGDHVQIQQAMVNLVLNAMEAMAGIDGAERSLHVRTESVASHYARMQLRDTGLGFRTEDAHRLFETFYTTKDGAMGLGLPISRAIIESHQGRIWAESDPGGGATLTFTLPTWREAGS